MNTTFRTAAGVSAVVGAVVLAVTLTGCSSSKKKDAAASSSPKTSANASTPPASSPASSSPATTDYTKLLIAASDVPLQGVTMSPPQAPPQGTGISAAFTAPGGRTLGDNILVFDSAAQAGTAATASVTAAKGQFSSPEVTSVPLGAGGTAIRGTSAGKAVAVVIWTEGRAVVVLEFDSAAGDPVPTALVQQVATKQDDLVKTGLPT